MDDNRPYVDEVLGRPRAQGKPADAKKTDAKPAEPTEIEVVRSFLGALELLDIDQALTYTAPDIVYQNVPLPPARGQAAFERQMRTGARFGSGFRAEIHNIAANGSIVLTERTDTLEVGPWRASFWVCGTFDVRRGRIVLWRDYFDYADVTRGMLVGLGRAVLSPVSRFVAGRTGRTLV